MINPVIVKQDLQSLIELSQKHNFIIVSDEMYSKLIYGNTDFKFIASFPGMKERSVIINGFSKTYAMTGWRLGYK
jgi:aspartate/methionine/tyrosine aminotransferase